MAWFRREARPLDAALAVELRRLERNTLSVWRALAAVGVLGGLAFSLVSRPLGLGAAVISAVFASLFYLLGLLLDRYPDARFPSLAMITVEAAIPWGFAWMAAHQAGAPYALGSWLPPMLFGGVMVSGAARLDPRAPIVLGLSAAAFHLTLYFVHLRPAVPEAQQHEALLGPSMQLSRAVSMVIAGAFAALVGMGVRRAISRADAVTREQELVGKYRLVGRIASGGMATVWEAVYCPEGGFERRVAIKRAHPHLCEEPRFVQAFRTEAELGSRLTHPAIVQVLDFGRVEASYFLAMEYVDGLVLSTLLERAWASGVRVPPGVASFVARETLAGLHHAHAVARGSDGQRLHVVHRDVCPQNVLVSRNGEVKVADFGIARALREATTAQTRTNEGHLAYMAPEQAREAPVDFRADLFPVAVMLWEMLTERRLFARGNEVLTLVAVTSGEIPRATEVRPDLDPSWDAFFDRALRRDPDLRFQTALEMIAALEALPDSRHEQPARDLALLVAQLSTGGGEEREEVTVGRPSRKQALP